MTTSFERTAIWFAWSAARCVQRRNPAIDASDLNHAVELMSKHPGIRVSTFEIRPIDEESTAKVNSGANP